MTNLVTIIFFFLALITAVLGIFGVAIGHLEFWCLGFLAAAFIAERVGGYVIAPRP